MQAHREDQGRADRDGEGGQQSNPFRCEHSRDDTRNGKQLPVCQVEDAAGGS